MYAPAFSGSNNGRSAIKESRLRMSSSLAQERDHRCSCFCLDAHSVPASRKGSVPDMWVFWKLARMPLGRLNARRTGGAEPGQKQIARITREASPNGVLRYVRAARHAPQRVGGSVRRGPGSASIVTK